VGQLFPPPPEGQVQKRKVFKLIRIRQTMTDKNYKILKNTTIVLSILTILLVIYAIITAFLFLKTSTQGLTGTPLVYFAVYTSVFLAPVLELILLIVCLVLIFKNKPWGYLGTGLISAYILYDSISTIVANNISFNWKMIVISLFRILLIVLSFYMYNNLRKVKK
jgi:hypothetical protein